ncbi:MAG TPA: MFS transporter, partial [Acidobacteriota bacterium]|nr:MFS transporter [Acidobacteriota bacterium]
MGQEFGFSKQELSWIYALTLLMTGAGGIAFGMLSDRWGRKTILQYTIVTYCAGTFLSGFAHQFAWLLVCRAITGLGVGGEWGAGHALISETFPPKRRGWFGALMQSGAAFGVGLAAIMGAFVAPEIGWRLTFIVSAIPASMVILIRRFLPESDVWLELKSRGQLPKYGALFGQLFTSQFRKITLLTFVLTAFNMCAYWFTYTWFPGYLKEVK